MPYVCRICGTPWPNRDCRDKPCKCWWGIRIWVEEDEDFVCGNCGQPWPIGQKPCNCWPMGIRIRKSEARDQEFPLPGL